MSNGKHHQYGATIPGIDVVTKGASIPKIENVPTTTQGSQAQAQSQTQTQTQTQTQSQSQTQSGK